MKDKKERFFCRALIYEGFRQTKWIGGIYLLLLVLNLIIENSTDAGVSNYVIRYTFYIMAALLIFVLFGFLTKRSASDVYQMLPIKKHQTYFSYGLVSFIWVAISIVLVSIGHYVIDWQTNHNIVFLHYIYQMISYLIGIVLVIGVSLLAVSVSGNTLSAVIVAAALLFVPDLIASNYIEVFYSICPHLTRNGVVGEIFNSQNNIVFNDFGGLNIWTLLDGMKSFTNVEDYGLVLENPPIRSYIYTSVVAVLYIVIGYVIYKKRSSEQADANGLNKWLSLLLRLAVSMALCLNIITDFAEYFLRGKSGGRITDIGGLFLLIVVIWYLLEFFTTKSIRQAFKSFLQLPIFLAVNVLAITFIVVSSDASSLVVPKASEIECVNVTSDLYFKTASLPGEGNFSEQLNYPGELLAKIDLDSEESKEYFADLLAEDMKLYRAGEMITYIKGYADYSDTTFSEKTRAFEVVYNTKSKKIRRNVYLNSHEILEAYELLLKESVDEYDFESPLTAYEPYAASPVLKVKSYGYGFELGNSDRVEVYNCLYKEMEAQKLPLSEYISQVYDKEDAFVYIQKSENYYDYYLPVSKSTPESLELLISLSNQPVNEEYFVADEDPMFRNNRDLELVILPKAADKIIYAEYHTNMGLDEAVYNEELKTIHDVLANPSEEISLDENIVVVHYRYHDKYKGSTWTNVSDEVLEGLINLKGVNLED